MKRGKPLLKFLMTRFRVLNSKCSGPHDVSIFGVGIEALFLSYRVFPNKKVFLRGNLVLFHHSKTHACRNASPRYFCFFFFLVRVPVIENNVVMAHCDRRMMGALAD